MLGVVRKGAATFSRAGMIALPLSQNRLASESGRFVTHEVLVIAPKEEALQALSIPKNIAWNLLTLRLSPRGELSRFDSKTKQFEPFLGRYLRPGCLLLQRRQVDSLCLLPRRHPVEGEQGWKQPRATDRPSAPGFHAPLVARRQEDLLCGQLSGTEWAILHRLLRWRQPQQFLAEDQHLDGFLTGRLMDTSNASVMRRHDTYFPSFCRVCDQSLALGTMVGEPPRGRLPGSSSQRNLRSPGFNERNEYVLQRERHWFLGDNANSGLLEGSGCLKFLLVIFTTTCRRSPNSETREAPNFFFKAARARSGWSTSIS
jgi:hypothetical protein